MKNSYIDKFQVHEIFTENKFQKILLGSSKENPEQIVVVNIINKNVAKSIISVSQFSKGLKNLVHLENTDEQLIIVTKCREGKSLSNYLNFFDATVRNRINLAYEYLAKTVQYDVFNNSLKALLVDESQIIIKNNDLYFNELMILDDKAKEYSDINSVIKVVIGVIEKIIFTNNSSSPLEDELLLKVSDFIDKLKNEKNNYINLEEIYEDFRKIYIYEMYLEDSDIKNNSFNTKENTKQDNDIEATENIENTPPILEKDNKEEDISESNTTWLDYMNDDEVKKGLDEKTEEDTNIREILLGIKQTDLKDDDDLYDTEIETNSRLRKWIPAVIIICLLLVAAFGLKSLLIKPAEPTAHFVMEKINDDTYYLSNDSVVSGKNNELKEIIWQIIKNNKIIHSSNKENLTFQPQSEGKYTIVLKIKDKYNRWSTSKDYIEYEEVSIDDFKSVDNSSEKLENINLNSSNDSTVKKDYDVFRRGTYSYLLGNEGEVSTSKININDLSFKSKPLVSMWLASDKVQEFDINIVGLKNGSMVFEKTSSYKFKEDNAWELFQVNDTSNAIDEIQIEFNNFLSPLWVDDIQIEPFK